MVHPWRAAASALPREEEPVADREDRGIDAGVGAGLLVQRADGSGRRVVGGGGIGELAAAEDVVEDDQAAGAEELERRLVIGVVGLLVGVDEGEVEGVGGD